MTVSSSTSVAASWMQQMRAGTPGDRLKPGEVKGDAAGAGGARDATKTGTPGDRSRPGEVKGFAENLATARDTTKTGTPGDRLKPGEVKGGLSYDSLMSSSLLSNNAGQLLDLLQ